MSRGAPDFSVDGRLREQQWTCALWFPLDLEDARAVPEGGEPFMVVSFAQHLLGHSLFDGRFGDLPPGERRRVHQEARRVIERERSQVFLQAGGVQPSAQADGTVRLDLPSGPYSDSGHLTAVTSPATGTVQDVQWHLGGHVRAVRPESPLGRLLTWSLEAANHGRVSSPTTAD